MKDLRLYIFLCLVSLCFQSCDKNLPSDKDAFSLDMNFSSKEFTPILGRNTYYTGHFNGDNSARPLSFRITSFRTYDQKEAFELYKLFPVKVWTSAYTGLENSIEEIESKRKIEMRPLFEIGQHSGDFTMWSSANENILKVFPDSGYYFNVEVENNGGRKYFNDFRLIPRGEQPYAPFSENGDVYPTIVANIIGEETEMPINPSNIKVWFHKVGPGNSLSFKFLDPDLNPIKLSKFNLVKDWRKLIHGFNMEMPSDSTYVKYEVAYPIPLSQTLATDYTTGDGESAVVMFSYRRIGRSGMSENAGLGLNFNIFQPGDWEIIFYFSEEAPKFDNY